MLKQPELEEETLDATALGQSLTVTRRTILAATPPDVTVTLPDGSTATLPLLQTGPGQYRAAYPASQLGLYRLQQGDLVRVIAVGPSAPKEFEQTLASGDKLAPIVATTKGGILALENGIPDLRLVSDGRPAAGRGWIGITPRSAFVTGDIRVGPVLPAWAYLLLAALASVLAWWREGRKRSRV